jgi:hypothetical protein
MGCWIHQKFDTIEKKKSLLCFIDSLASSILGKEIERLPSKVASISQHFFVISTTPILKIKINLQ